MSGLTKLPQSWVEVEFGELFLQPESDVVDGPFGSNLKASEYVYQGIPIVRLQNIDRNRFLFKNIQYVTEEKAIELARHTFIPGDILITKLGAPLGKACLAPSSIERGVLVADVVRARITHPWIDRRFLCYQINAENVIQQFKEQTKGTTRPRVNLTKIRALKVRLCSNAEQTRIVEKLEELLSNLDAGVFELKAAQKKLTQYRQALLKAAVEGKLTADWRSRRATHGEPLETGAQLLARILAERRRRWQETQLARFTEQGRTPPRNWQDNYPEPLQPDTSGLPELPEGWAWAKVGLIGDLQLGRQRAPQYHKGDNMVPYLRVANVFEDRIDVSDLMEMHFSPEEEDTFRLRHGDILLNEGQSLELVGRSAIYRDELPRACFTNTLVRVRVEDDIKSEFAQIVFLHYLHSGRFRKVATITTNIAHLGAGRLAEIEFPLPGPEEQKAIVVFVNEEMDRFRQSQEAIKLALHQSEAQRKNILKAAFAGQLVSQDPHDESASVLLERIRAERAVRRKQSKPRQAKLPKRGVKILMTKLIDVLTETKDWLAAEEAFRRCDVADGTSTDRIEELYVELRELDQAQRLEVRRVNQSDELRLKSEV